MSLDHAVLVISLLISLASLAVAIVGTVLSYRRSGEALRESRRAATEAVWSEAIEAVTRLIGFDPSAGSPRDALLNVRVRLDALVDRLGEGWADFERWLVTEQVLGGTIVEGAVLDLDANPERSPKEYFDILSPLNTWANAFTVNLRTVRRTGHDASLFDNLTARARSARANLDHRRGGGERS